MGFSNDSSRTAAEDIAAGGDGSGNGRPSFGQLFTNYVDNRMPLIGAAATSAGLLPNQTPDNSKPSSSGSGLKTLLQLFAG